MPDACGVEMAYLIRSSSDFFSSESLFKTAMIISCSSSVRWLRSIIMRLLFGLSQFGTDWFSSHSSIALESSVTSESPSFHNHNRTTCKTKQPPVFYQFSVWKQENRTLFRHLLNDEKGISVTQFVGWIGCNLEWNVTPNMFAMTLSGEGLFGGLRLDWTCDSPVIWP